MEQGRFTGTLPQEILDICKGIFEGTNLVISSHLNPKEEGINDNIQLVGAIRDLQDVIEWVAYKSACWYAEKVLAKELTLEAAKTAYNHALKCDVEANHDVLDVAIVQWAIYPEIKWLIKYVKAYRKLDLLMEITYLSGDLRTPEFYCRNKEAEAADKTSEAADKSSPATEQPSSDSDTKTNAAKDAAPV